MKESLIIFWGDFARGRHWLGRHCQGATLFQPGASRVEGDFAGGDFVGGELVRWRDDQHSSDHGLGAIKRTE